MHPAPARSARFPRWAAAAIAAGSGLAGAYAYPRVGLWPLAIVSVAGLSVAVDARRSRTGAWLGYVYGAAFFVPLLHWTGIYVGPVPWLILAAAEAAYCAGLGALLPRLQRLPLAPLWVGAGWVLQEAVRDRWPFGGFPWGRLGFSQATSPLRWFVALGGVPLLSFMVAVAGAGLARAVLALSAGRPRPMLVSAAVPVAVVVGGVLLSVAPSPLGPTTGPSAALRVAIVQGAVPDRGLGFEDRARQVLDNHVRETFTLAAEVSAGRLPQPQLVVWPENASDVDPYRDATARAEISSAVRAVGAPVLVGAILQGPGPHHRRNVGILWSPVRGPGARYVKRHPVPFAEYMPLRALAQRVSSAAKLVTQDMVSGSGNGLLRGGPVPLGDVICFEVAYDGLVRSSVSAGARLFVVQTNNATFGHTSETYQQLAMSRLRAIETGRTVLQASTTGVSAVISPTGSVLRRSDRLFRPALLSASVPLRSGLTPAVRLGVIPEIVLTASALIGVLCTLRGARPRRRSRRQHRAAPAVDPVGVR